MLAPAFAAGINHLLAGASWARARLTPFADRRAAFLVPPVSVAFRISTEGFFVPDADGTPVDVTICLPAPASAPTLWFQGVKALMAAAHVEGNAEFATELSFVFRHLRWDAEEDLSRWVGDIAAHRLVRAAHACREAARSGVSRLTENLSEYVRHETAACLGRDEFAAFRDDLAAFLARLDCLEQRVAIRS